MRKRILLVCMAAALLLTGCGAGRSPKTEDAPPELTGPGTPGGEDGYYGTVYVGKGQTLESSGDVEGAEGDVNIVLVQNGGKMTLTDTKLYKTGDATGTVATGGGNAAVAVTGGGTMEIRDTVIRTGGFGAHGLFVGDTMDGQNMFTVTGENLTIETAGSTSAGIYADLGTVTLTGGSVTTKATDGTSPAFLLKDHGQVMLDKVQVNTAGSLAEMLGKGGALDAMGTELSGDVKLAVDDDATVSISLSGDSRWTGTIVSDTVQNIHVSLDATSTWTLTAETSVDSFMDGDGTFANIQSGGYNLYYNASNENNASLKAQSYELPGGGYLSPMI